MDSEVSLSQAAAVCMVSERALRTRWNKRQADRRADEVGLARSEWDSLLSAVRGRLLMIATDEGFRAGAMLAHWARLSTSETPSWSARSTARSPVPGRPRWSRASRPPSTSIASGSWQAGPRPIGPVGGVGRSRGWAWRWGHWGPLPEDLTTLASPPSDYPDPRPARRGASSPPRRPGRRAVGRRLDVGRQRRGLHRPDRQSGRPRADHREWQRLLRTAGVPAARLHDARHTAATLLLAHGVPARVVMELLGHSQITLTLGTIRRLCPSWPVTRPPAWATPFGGESGDGHGRMCCCARRPLMPMSARSAFGRDAAKA